MFGCCLVVFGSIPKLKRKGLYYDTSISLAFAFLSSATRESSSSAVERKKRKRRDWQSSREENGMWQFAAPHNFRISYAPSPWSGGGGVSGWKLLHIHCRHSPLNLIKQSLFKASLKGKWFEWQTSHALKHDVIPKTKTTLLPFGLESGEKFPWGSTLSLWATVLHQLSLYKNRGGGET